ncbi:MAG: hypothetical protein Tsb002_14780 [Wenzhouxiangellaceae bacterium]
MFDINKTISLIKGGLLQPEPTWERFLGENPSLQQTFIQLTGPLLAAQVVLSVILSRIFGGFSALGLAYGWFMGIIMGLVMGLIFLALTTLVVSFCAGMFGGRQNLNRAFAAVSLAIIPSYIATIIGAIIPWIGGFIALAGGIWSLVNLYKLIPPALGVPEGKRPLHFIVSLVAIVIINMIVSMVLGLGAVRGNISRGYMAENSDSGYSSGSGMFGEIERQGRLVEDAEDDRYQPPADGKVSKAQVEQLISVLGKAEKLQQREEEKLKQWAEDMDKKESASLSDLGKMFEGVGRAAIGTQTAEMEVVKTAGGNWAEHQWVKEQLRVAMIQEDTNDAIKHNYALYQQFSDQLDPHL